MWTGQLTECYEPLQKLRVGLSTSKLVKAPVMFYITYHFKAVLVLVSISVLLSPIMCLDDI